MARLSPSSGGTSASTEPYSFVLADLAPGVIRELRDPDARDDDDD